MHRSGHCSLSLFVQRLFAKLKTLTTQPARMTKARTDGCLLTKQVPASNESTLPQSASSAAAVAWTNLLGCLAYRSSFPRNDAHRKTVRCLSSFIFQAKEQHEPPCYDLNYQTGCKTDLKPLSTTHVMPEIPYTICGFA